MATVGTVFSSSIVAYGLARCRFRGKKILVVAMLLSMMLPAQVLMIPQYLWYQKLGWVNSYMPLIIPYCFAVQGFFTYLMMNFIQGIPRELTKQQRLWLFLLRDFRKNYFPADAACVDYFRYFFLYVEMDHFLSALLYINDSAKYPVSLALSCSVTRVPLRITEPCLPWQLWRRYCRLC